MVIVTNFLHRPIQAAPVLCACISHIIMRYYSTSQCFVEKLDPHRGTICFSETVISPGHFIASSCMKSVIVYLFSEKQLRQHNFEITTNCISIQYDKLDMIDTCFTTPDLHCHVFFFFFSPRKLVLTVHFKAVRLLS